MDIGGRVSDVPAEQQPAMCAKKEPPAGGSFLSYLRVGLFQLVLQTLQLPDHVVKGGEIRVVHLLLGGAQLLGQGCVHRQVGAAALAAPQALLGDAFDYAINACDISGNDFVKLFSVSSVSKRIENGEPAYLAGKSGIEVVEDILVETTGKAPTVKPQVTFSRSREYWVGWAIAYYQWFSGRKFSDIFKVLSFEDLLQMYAPLHEADISKFADIADAKVRAYFTDTNLKRIRTTYGCTQAELAKRSGVSLRSIQMYEQHNKDINKASAETVLSLAKVLGCTMEDLLEK